MQKLTQLAGLAGKTIRGAFDSRNGRDMVLVFEDDDWCVLTIDNEMSEDEAVWIDCHALSQYDSDIKNFLSPEDLLAARLLTPAQYDYLVEQERMSKAARMRQRAEALISEANQLMEAKA